MCGFFISNNPNISSNHTEILEKTLRFRGPDCSSGLISVGKWKAYHSRLSIIDLGSGVNQPVVDKNGGLLVFNGEILNFRELGQKYFAETFASDTLLLSQLIVHDYLDINELDGFFSFVYVDYLGKLKYAVRDKFGVKPLFYYENSGFISFSSEPSTLKKIFELKINPSAITEYKALRAPIFSQSFFQGVKQVQPGTCLINGQYFDIRDFFTSQVCPPTTQELKNSLIKAIETRKVSDAPIGLLLSKGIDSNLIRSLSSFEHYFSIGFKGDADYEYLRTQEIENLTLAEFSEEKFKKDFEYLIALRCEPLSVPNEVALFHIAKLAANKGIKVLLSGEGADEFFAGYDRIFKWAQAKEAFNLKEFLSLYCYSEIQVNSDIFNEFKDLFDGCNLTNVFDIVRWFFIRYHMPILFRRLDFSLMAAGVEGREPLANFHIFQEAIRYSAKNLMTESLGKKPLRDLLSEHMGKEFSFEKKVGFPIDLTNIFANPKKLTSYELWFEKNLEVLQ